MTEPPRVILHLDMDAFYAAIEVRENPALRGKAVIVGHPGRRGVVSTCSYEARRFGVRSAMPSVTALRLCPRGIWVPGRMRLYVEVSRRIRAIVADASPLIEPLSIDEAFVDLTGLAQDLGAGARTGRLLKRRILDSEGLTCSIGVAPNKFLAKVASDLEKPDGLVLFPLSAVAARLWPLPVTRLWGVGQKTAERLSRGGIRTVGDLDRTSPETLRRWVGEHLTGHLKALARGQDTRPVVARRDAKSISEERTYGEDLTDPDVIDRELLARSEGVSRQLRRVELAARTVHLKVRTGNYETMTRAETLTHPTDLTEVLVASARRLLQERVELRGRGVRLIGLGVSGLEPRGHGQGLLFLDEEELRARRRARASDAVCDRLGERAMTRARLLRARSGGKEPPSASSLPSVD